MPDPMTQTTVLHCKRCGYDVPMRGLETPQARADLAGRARVSRIAAIVWLRETHAYSLSDGKLVMNHITWTDEAGHRRCYKCGQVDVIDGHPCPNCRSLALDW